MREKSLYSKLKLGKGYEIELAPESKSLVISVDRDQNLKLNIGQCSFLQFSYSSDRRDSYSKM